MHAEGRNITLCITNKPVSNRIDIESYKNQNNAAARWLEGLGTSPADKQEAKDNREQGVDTKVYANQCDTVDIQDEPNEEIVNIEEHPTELEPTAKFGDGSPEDRLVAMVYEQLADQWDSPDLDPKILPRARVTTQSVSESLVMLRVWLINGQLDENKELPGTDRQQRLLLRYQSQQSPILFWVFMKQFRHLIWKTELKRGKSGNGFAGEGPEDDFLDGKVTTVPEGTFVKLTARRNCNARAS
ncbi:hypothetical protein FCOIX_8056 [Fusarium coicis]|nr:hypothetical protein FCOIX_8056 [Fusarium coicis]